MKRYQIYLSFLIMFIAFASRSNAEISLFTDRAAWQQAVMGTVTTEDFDSEPASYDVLILPYVTERGITFNWINHQYDTIQMLPDGLVNGSIAPHFRAFGDQLSITFPTDASVTAFGFDYFYNDPEVWEMYVNGSKFVLTPNFPPRFIGVMDTTQQISSFVLTSPSYAQGGLSIDNVSYNIVFGPPVLAPVGSSWVYKNTLLSFDLTATDPDGDTLVYGAMDLPQGASLDPYTGHFEWTPSGSQVGSHRVTFTVSDGHLEDYEATTITVYDGSGPMMIKKAAVKKQAAREADKLVAEFSKTELDSTFAMKVSILSKEAAAKVTATTFKECPKSPVGFQVGDVCMDISTDAASIDSVEICVSYDEKAITSEMALKLEHYEDGKWVNITTKLDAEKNVICGKSTKLSPFALITSVGDIVAPVEPQAVGAGVDVSADFIDQDILRTHTATIDWGDGVVWDCAIDEEQGSGTANCSHIYAMPGVYTIALRVYDDLGLLLGESVYRYVVAYDPGAGFVTGGGWIDSPEGAYATDPILAGKANFGFVSRYKKGANTPSGNTEFQFNAAYLNFHSDTYEWLVVAGAKAQFKGIGFINGEGNYGFMLTAIDGALPGGGGSDKFRIKIWDRANDQVVYDNMLGAADDADPSTAIGGGSIVIHK